jgi:hypothetical protein
LYETSRQRLTRRSPASVWSRSTRCDDSRRCSLLYTKAVEEGHFPRTDAHAKNESSPRERLGRPAGGIKTLRWSCRQIREVDTPQTEEVKRPVSIAAKRIPTRRTGADAAFSDPYRTACLAGSGWFFSRGASVCTGSVLGFVLDRSTSAAWQRRGAAYRKRQAIPLNPLGSGAATGFVSLRDAPASRVSHIAVDV